MEYTIAYILFSVLVILAVAAMICINEGKNKNTNTHSDDKYIVKKITDNVYNTVIYKVCRRDYHSHIGYVYTCLKEFEKEDLAMELAKKLMTDGEKKEEILYVEKQTN